jgi:hypothetical protein
MEFVCRNFTKSSLEVREQEYGKENSPVVSD